MGGRIFTFEDLLAKLERTDMRKHGCSQLHDSSDVLYHNKFCNAVGDVCGYKDNRNCETSIVAMVRQNRLGYLGNVSGSAISGKQ